MTKCEPQAPCPFDGAYGHLPTCKGYQPAEGFRLKDDDPEIAKATNDGFRDLFARSAEDTVEVKAELLPCPFCSNEVTSCHDAERFWIFCVACDAEGSKTPLDRKELVIAAWNRRADRPADLEGKVLVDEDQWNFYRDEYKRLSDRPADSEDFETRAAKFREERSKAWSEFLADSKAAGYTIEDNLANRTLFMNGYESGKEKRNED